MTILLMVKNKGVTYKRLRTTGLTDSLVHKIKVKTAKTVLFVKHKFTIDYNWVNLIFNHLKKFTSQQEYKYEKKNLDCIFEYIIYILNNIYITLLVLIYDSV